MNAHLSSTLSGTSSVGSYKTTVRAAHALADLIKRSHPHLCEQVSDIQATITRCQCTLDKAKEEGVGKKAASQRNCMPDHVAPALDAETLSALKELETATQTLLDLRHRGQMAR